MVILGDLRQHRFMTTFPRIGRIKVERTIGSGSFGRVYLAWDEDRQQAIAVKQLTRLGPEGVLRFKQEFRLLADLNHPNLVNLYELLAEGGELAFTMEFVDGQPFGAWVRGEAAPLHGEGTADTDSLPPGPSPWVWDESPTIPGSSAGGPALPEPPAIALRSPDRLRRALAQLTAGIQALHGAGLLHLDLKSNNVLVTREGRVVILDFGLSREEEVPGAVRGAEALQGTPSHLAPEVAHGQPATEASDWYSVGVMLFESLTGRLPFLGSPREMIRAKVHLDAPRPQALCPTLPEDLCQLCQALLARDPAQRAGAAEILAVLGGAAARVDSPGRRAPLVGRETDLEFLHLAQASTRSGRFRALLLNGPFGVGKTALLRVFTKELARRDARAVTLLGRCFEQESVPFKGMDGVVDALSHHLRRLPGPEVEALLPRDLPLLAQLFPVLRQVPVLAERAGNEASRLPDPEEDAQAIRRLAFRALRSLLARMAIGRPLVIILDDFQWADTDTVALVLELIQPPEAPGLLLVVSYRSGADPVPAPLAAFLKALRETGAARDERTLEPLDPDLSETLALSLVADLDRAGAIAREAGGHPWLIHELALETGQDPAEDGVQASFQRIVSDRVAALPDPAREILRFLALAGYPLPWDTVRRAAGVQAEGPDPVALLRGHHLARIGGKPAHRVLEIYHDRVRDVVLETLTADQVRDGHLRIALALEASGGPPDSQALSYHYLGAGEMALAARHSAAAARQSEAALAFDRAAALYRRTIALLPPEDPRLPDLRARLANALVNTGHSWEAAQEFQALAQERPEDSRRFERRAAEEYFRSGHVSEGFRIGAGILRRMGLRVPPTPVRAMGSLLYHRFRLALRGLAFRERPEERIPRERLERIDALWSMAMGLGPFDLTRATDFQTRHLLEALKAGEPRRLVRGLAHETALRSAKGHRAEPAVLRLLSRTLALAERVGQPEALARAQLAAAISATAQGRWRAAVEWSARAEATLDQCRWGVIYEVHMAQFYWLRNALVLGDFEDVRRRYSGLLQEARAQGDLLTTTNLQVVVGSMLLLCADRPDQAQEVLDQALAGWPREAYLLQHLECLVSRCNALLYERREREALVTVLAQWRALEASFLLQAEALRATSLELRVRVHLAAEQDAEARRWNRVLDREACGYGRALALKNRGVLLVREGKPAEGAGRLFEAEMALAGAELHLHAHCVRRARGVLVGGRVGQDLLSQADDWMRSRGVIDPERMTWTLVPGLG